jgi:Ca2+-binding RTX toxin-like protein
MFYNGGGEDTMTGGTGNDVFYINNNPHTGSSINGDGGADTIVVDNNLNISSMILSNVQTLEAAESMYLTAGQLSGFSTLIGDSSINWLNGSTGGTYSLLGKTVTGKFNMVAQSNSGTTLIENNTAGAILDGSSSGNDTLVGGNGCDTFNAGGGSDILIAGTGNDTLNGGGGYDTYKFGSGFGSDVITNNGGSAAKGEVVFTSANYEQLWFLRSGNNLQIDLLGTNDEITLSNWFGSSAGAQVQSFDTASGYKLDGQIAQLI